MGTTCVEYVRKTNSIKCLEKVLREGARPQACRANTAPPYKRVQGREGGMVRIEKEGLDG